MAAVNSIEQIHINMEDIDFLRSLSIGWYVEGWGHAFALCSNCGSYHTLSQGSTCMDGGSILHRVNAMTNYLYLPDPQVPLLSPPESPEQTAQEPVEEPGPLYVIYSDDNETITEDEGEE